MLTNSLLDFHVLIPHLEWSFVLTSFPLIFDSLPSSYIALSILSSLMHTILIVFFCA